MKTLQDVFREMGASVSEVELIRALVTSGKYRMTWSNAQWYNRMQGRTWVSSAERVALGVVLERVRREQLTFRENSRVTILHSPEEFMEFINNSDIALRVTRRCIYNDDGELVGVLV